MKKTSQTDREYLLNLLINAIYFIGSGLQIVSVKEKCDVSFIQLDHKLSDHIRVTDKCKIYRIHQQNSHSLKLTKDAYLD